MREKKLRPYWLFGKFTSQNCQGYPQSMRHETTECTSMHFYLQNHLKAAIKAEPKLKGFLGRH